MDDRPWALFVLVLVLAAAACSDDGLAPELDPEGTSTTGMGATSSVNTSATITASASASAEEGGSGGPASEGEASGLGETTENDGVASSGTGGDGGSTDDAFPPETTGGLDEPDCVATDDCVCVPGEVFCEAVRPRCPPGTLPEVDVAAGCWSFGCVPVDRCTSVPDCEACGEDFACVLTEALGGPVLTCEVVPPECLGDPSCVCMPDVCERGFECFEPPKAVHDLACICPAC